MKKIYFALAMLFAANSIFAQFNIDAGATNYTQPFDGLGTVAGTWADNTTLAGWYARTDATAFITAIGVNTGSTTTAGLYSYGVAGTNALTDRALGYATSNGFTGTAGSGKNYLGWRLKNNTGGTISSVTVTWSGEQWRRDNALAQSLVLSYQTGATVTAVLGGTWTSASSTFTSPQLSATALALDGNAPANRVAAISATISGLTLLPGEEIMLRWEDLNDSGNDHQMAIDDVTVNATVAAPAGTSTITAGAGTEAPLVSSMINTQGAAVLNFDFTIQDDGSTPATDALASQISQLSFTAGTGNTVSNWSLVIAGAELSDGTNSTTSVTIGTSSLTFAALPNTAGAIGEITDNASKTYTLKIWLKTDLTTLKTIIDGENFVFRLQNSGVTLTGSQLAAAQDVNSGSANNKVDVTATALAYIQQPSTTGINVAMSPDVTVAAIDGNGNRDLDFVESVRITSTGTLTGSPVDVAAVSGVATFSGLTHSTGGTGLTLNAERTNTLDFDIISTTFNIINPSNATDFFRSKAPGGNWNSIATWETSADGNTWSDATLVPDELANTITIRNGHTVSITAPASADQLVVETTGTLALNADLTVADGPGTDLTVNGTVINTSGTHTVTGTIAFNANSLYQHNRNGQPVLTASWDINSTAEITGATSAVPSNLGQLFGNFTWNSPGQTASLNFSGTLTNIAGNLTIANNSTTAGRLIRLFGTTANAVATIGGDLIITSANGRLEYSNGNATNSILNIGGNFNQSAGSFSANVSGALAINFTGTNKTFTHSGGTLTNTQINWFVTNTASLTLNNDIPVAASRTLQVDGILTAGTFQVTGTGAAVINNILRTANINGLSLTGTFANTGGYTLGAGSTIDYNAAVDQEFTANNGYVNVIISNGANKILNGISTISGTLNLTSGIVVTTISNLLVLNQNASYTGGSTLSYIDGPLQRNTIAAASYTFPVGKGGAFKTFDIIPATATGSSFIGEYFTPNINTTAVPCTPAKLEGYLNNEYWNVSRTVGTDNAAIRLNYSQATSNGNWTNGTSIVADPDASKAITVATYLTGSNCWEVYQDINSLLPGDAVSGQAATMPLSTFGQFTFGYGPLAALPITINYLHGARQGNINNLTWMVNCTNSPTANMLLERSRDAHSFESVYGITAPAVRCLQSFTYNDISPLAGVNYYRLKMTDADGRFSYSQTISILNKDKGFEILSVSPNPVQGKAMLSLSTTAAGKMNIVITNVAGKVVSSQSVVLASGSNILPLETAGLPAGTYQVTGMIENGEIKTLRFIKE